MLSHTQRYKLRPNGPFCSLPLVHQALSEERAYVLEEQIRRLASGVMAVAAIDVPRQNAGVLPLGQGAI